MVTLGSIKQLMALLLIVNLAVIAGWFLFKGLVKKRYYATPNVPLAVGETGGMTINSDRETETILDSSSITYDDVTVREVLPDGSLGPNVLKEHTEEDIAQWRQDMQKYEIPPLWNFGEINHDIDGVACDCGVCSARRKDLHGWKEWPPHARHTKK